MRLVAVVAIIATCLAGAALAREEVALFVPRWESESHPSHAYPPDALERGVAGITHLCCTVREDRTLNCNVAIEWPENYGFGASAQRFMSGWRLTPESYAELQALPHQTLHYPFRYQVLPAPAELDGIVREVRARATGICGPEAGPIGDDIVIEVRRH